MFVWQIFSKCSFSILLLYSSRNGSFFSSPLVFVVLLRVNVNILRFCMCTTFNLFCSTQFDYLHHFIFSWSNLLTIVLVSYYRKLTFRCIPFHLVLPVWKIDLNIYIRTSPKNISYMQWWKETRSIQILLAVCTFDSSALKSKWHVIAVPILTFNMLFVTGSNVWICEFSVT